MLPFVFIITDRSLIKHKAVVIKFVNGIKSIACCTKFFKSSIKAKVCSTLKVDQSIQKKWFVLSEIKL